TQEQIDIAAQGIKIISENIDESTEFQQARKLMSDARRIAILGFGYHHVNMKRLAVPTQKGYVWGTSLGLADAERIQLTTKYAELQLTHHGCGSLEWLRNISEFQRD